MNCKYCKRPDTVVWVGQLSSNPHTECWECRGWNTAKEFDDPENLKYECVRRIVEAREKAEKARHDAERLRKAGLADGGVVVV